VTGAIVNQTRQVGLTFRMRVGLSLTKSKKNRLTSTHLSSKTLQSQKPRYTKLITTNQTRQRFQPPETTPRLSKTSHPTMSVMIALPISTIKRTVIQAKSSAQASTQMRSEEASTLQKASRQAQKDQDQDPKTNTMMTKFWRAALNSLTS
jgi:hypothetical protein